METFAFNIAERVLGLLASRAYDEISLAWGVKVELDKLKETLETITILLLDAEEKQIKDRRITHWLGKLKDVCYDADEVLDEFEYQKLRTQVLNPGSIKGQVRKAFSRRNSLLFRIKMGRRIKDIRERLHEIDGEKNQFSLSERAHARSAPSEIERETHSYVKAVDVIGREEDEKQIISHLLNDLSQPDESVVSVMSIIGLGGLGKTTLAKLVYNNKKVVKRFELRMWVSVSDNFDNKRLAGDIISSATGEKCGDKSLEQLQIELRGVLGNKKFLLVLDDVWDKEPMGVTSTKWIDLKSLLDVGGSGSRIIVTTRNESVASLMGSIHMYPLEGLPSDDSMSLFRKMAFGKGEEGKYPQLMKIGEDIVKKCGGIPLALTTVGSLLFLTRELQEWLRVRDDDNWKSRDDGILPALKLSYDALPLYLKPCFAYCSLFPKDYTFKSMELVPLWLAEGFLQSSNGNHGFEEIGLGYIRQLCSRSLFQKISEFSFQMHDLVHDLAISLTQSERSSSSFGPSDGSKRIRRVFIPSTEFDEDMEQVPEFLLESDKVRTLIIPHNHFRITNKSFLETCISRFKYLRVLFMGHSFLSEVSSSIGNLSHLRYLDLSGNPISKLPDSICKLHNLKILSLLRCDKLEELPKYIGNLISLVKLEVTTKQMHFPKGIGGLTSLQSLRVRNCRHLKSFGEEIQCLTNLRKLHIEWCFGLESLPGNMKHLVALESLHIEYCDKLDLDSGEGICCLRSFSITNSRLKALPNWLRDCATTLERICLFDCRMLMALPEWVQDLTLLKQIEISRASPHLREDCYKIFHAIKVIFNGRVVREPQLTDNHRILKLRIDEIADFKNVAIAKGTSR